MDDETNTNGHAGRASAKPSCDVMFRFQAIEVLGNEGIDKLKEALGSTLIISWQVGIKGKSPSFQRCPPVKLDKKPHVLKTKNGRMWALLSQAWECLTLPPLKPPASSCWCSEFAFFALFFPPRHAHNWKINWQWGWWKSWWDTIGSVPELLFHLPSLHQVNISCSLEISLIFRFCTSTRWTKGRIVHSLL